MNFVIGGRGRLGNAICKSYLPEDITSLDRSIYANWWNIACQDDISRYFEARTKPGSLIFITAGILDPKLAQEAHLNVNYLLPKNIIEATSHLGLKVVTFGTIMEELVSTKNAYIESKSMLSNFISELSDVNTLHIRIHTLYGNGLPSPSMFLGQLYSALKNRSIFKMSSGNQLREYHHIDDDVAAIHTLINKKIHGIFNLNHGKPVKLKDIASYVFEKLFSEELLSIGAYPEPKYDNYHIISHRPIELDEVEFRETLPNILFYLKKCLLNRDLLV
ncbi:ADP-glyceromanno-heptose 6-epimerase [Yersinia frederiksenii]|uniref:ADP-glyceromanno-heptose 6-epimerase n=2 Tax=Yersinia frederiksenii TaxID=29484 RepID=A0A380PXD4_YERFR|nr:NAD(P)-dependent oxidoreductase [Yersinia frederiksenii]ATM93996.1 NAD(P)-dependent oxidoreductase [Yersinia frederiksenii]KGA45326.1 NAD dependent epimerase/dehydratase family protein [Yersinia frederiksenii ATCC 33641]SUP77607.1 ADP-glyceromanno-heptose 6-epimerase [Yersinia frederiksenii]